MRQLELSHYLNSPALTEHCCIVLCPPGSRWQARPGRASKHIAGMTHLHLQSVSHIIEYAGTSSHSVTTQGNRSGAVGERDDIIIIIVIHLSDDY